MSINRGRSCLIFGNRGSARAPQESTPRLGGEAFECARGKTGRGCSQSAGFRARPHFCSSTPSIGRCATRLTGCRCRRVSARPVSAAWRISSAPNSPPTSPMRKRLCFLSSCRDVRKRTKIGRAIGRLDREHAEDRALSARVRLLLLEAVTTRRPPAATPGAAEALRTFARNQRQHMTLENAVLIPLARRRFDPFDLADLGRRLAVRRSAAPASQDIS